MNNDKYLNNNKDDELNDIKLFQYKLYISEETNRRLNDIVEKYTWYLIKDDATYLTSLNIFTISDDDFEKHLKRLNDFIGYYIDEKDKYISEKTLIRKKKLNRIIDEE